MCKCRKRAVKQHSGHHNKVGCCDRCKKVDLDDVLAYNTQRVVRIRDRTLGIAYLLLVTGIAVGFVVQEVIINQGYKLQGAAFGTTRLQTKQPQAEDRNEHLLYCGEANYTYNGQTWDQHPCAYWDAYDAVFPSIEARATFVTSRFTRLEQSDYSPGCENLLQQSCAYTNESSSVYFVADPAMFTLRVDHTINVPQFDLSRSSHNMHGAIVDRQGNVLDPCSAYTDRNIPCPSYVHLGSEDASAADTFPVQLLLHAAGIESLDEPSGVGDSHRYDGVILVVRIDYDNYYSYDPYNIRYTYSVTPVSKTEFKTVQVIPTDGLSSVNRTILNRHGVRMIFVQAASIGFFDVTTCLVALAGLFAPLTLATLVVDFWMQNMGALKHAYRQYKTVKSLEVAEYTEPELKRIKVNPPVQLPDSLVPLNGEVDEFDDPMLGSRRPSRQSRRTSRTRSRPSRHSARLSARGSTMSYGSARSEEGMDDYMSWLRLWKSRVQHAYSPYVPTFPVFLLQEHPLLAVFYSDQPNFSTGRLGRLCIFILLAGYTMFASAAADRAARDDDVGYYFALYLLGVPTALVGSSLWCGIFKGFAASKLPLVILLSLLALIAEAGGVVWLLMTRPEDATPSLPQVLIQGAVGLAATLLLEVPKQLLAWSLKPNSISWLLLLRACCYTRSMSPWKDSQKFRRFFASINVGGYNPDDEYVRQGSPTSLHSSYSTHQLATLGVDDDPAVIHVAGSYEDSSYEDSSSDDSAIPERHPDDDTDDDSVMTAGSSD